MLIIRGEGQAKGKAVVATAAAAGRIDASSEVEVVGPASIRVGPWGPVGALLASEPELITTVRINGAAPHKDWRMW